MKTDTIQQNIPKGWKQVALGDLLSVTTGKRDANHGSPDGQYPFFTCAQKVSKIDNFAFDTEAVLIAGNGDFNVKYYKGKFDAYQRTYVLSGFKDTTGSFVYQKAKQALNEIIKNNQGSSVKFIKMGDLTDYPLLLPPIKEQQKIAEILGTVDEDIAKTQEVIKSTEKLKRGLMQQLFTRGIGHTKFKETKIGQIPEGWEVVLLGQVTNFIDYRGKTPKKTESGISLITAKNVRQGYVSAEPREYIAESDYDGWMTRGIPKIGDVLFTTEAPLGYVAQIDISEKIALAQRIITIQSDVLNHVFLKYMLTSQNIQNVIQALGTGGTVKGIKASVLKKLEVPKPSPSEQKEIAEILSAVDEKISVNKKVKEKLTLLKKGLMQDLLSGKVRTIQL